MDSAIATPIISLVLGTIGGGLANYWLRRREERAKVGDTERLAGYGRLVASLDGFVEGAPGGKAAFLAESRKALLYASADVLQRTREFLNAFTSERDQDPVDMVPDEVADPLVANLLLAMRRDLGFADERVDPAVFRILRVTERGRLNGPRRGMQPRKDAAHRDRGSP